MLKRVGIIGSTGTVGGKGLRVIKNNPHRFSLSGFTGHSNIKEILKIKSQFPDAIAVITNEEININEKDVKQGYKYINDIIEQSDILLFSASGTETVDYVLTAIKEQRRVALSTKEIVVAYGEIFKNELSKKNVIPVDSEHSAIFQTLLAGRHHDIEKIVLTASGGPFRNKDYSNASIEDVLAHPIWNMGDKITVDSATLMNKTLEVIEASYLFNVDSKDIDVYIHPQSVVHGITYFKDGSLIMHASQPDMLLPVQYAFTYPERIKTAIEPISIEVLNSMSFEKPDFKRFPCLKLGYEVLEKKGNMPAALIGADENVVACFLKGRIKFKDIFSYLEKTLNKIPFVPEPDAYQIKKTMEEAKRFIKEELCF